MFSFFGKKKPEPPVTVNPEPYRDDFVLVGQSNPGPDPTRSGPMYPNLPPAPPTQPSEFPPHPSGLTRMSSISNSKPYVAVEGVPFKLASNFQTADVFTDLIQRQINEFSRSVERISQPGLEYNFQTEREVISEYS